MNKIGAYLAAPFTHTDPMVEEWRFHRINEAAALLIRGGFDSLYSPISHTYPIDGHLAEHKANHDFWVNKFDLPFLEHSERLLVLMLPGWLESTGVKMEMKQAEERGISVSLVMPVYDKMFRLIGVEVNP